MNPVIALRSEFVCFVILVFLYITARSYQMGKDSKIFTNLLVLAIVHVFLDAVTLVTVNNWQTLPLWLNYVLHIFFYITAMLYAMEIFVYVAKMCYPTSRKDFNFYGILLPAAYLVCLPLLDIDYVQCKGTWSSSGTAAYVGYGIAFIYFLTALIMIYINFRKIKRSVKVALLPMMAILVLTELTQAVHKELLFTGGAITIVTVGFFFSLENPIHVFEQKAMTDALTGLGSRHSYNEDIAALDEKFKANPNNDYIFAFCDINNLKAINGMYGHHEGDNYITFVAMALSKALKKARGIYRMGGDEFLVIYSGVDEFAVERELENLQNLCANEGAHRAYTPGVAVGYAVSGPEYSTLRDVLRTADYLMYRNKADMKRSKAFVAGTRLNLAGLTDRLFTALCSQNERSYPFITNMETSVTRISPAWVEYFNLPDEFMPDFLELWIRRVHPDDRHRFTDEITDVFTGRKHHLDINFRAVNANNQYVLCSCRGSICHGGDGEPDIFAGYLENHGIEETIDIVTGLYNFASMTAEIQRLHDEGNDVVAVKLDISNLSRLNMLYGYAGVDAIIRNVAAVMKDKISNRGELFCQDGRNFSFVVPSGSRQEAFAVYSSIVSALSFGVEYGSAMVPMEIAGGAIEIPKDKEFIPEDSRSSILFAMNESRDNYSNELVFADSVSTDATFADNSLLSAVHKDAVSGMEYFKLSYQPIIDTISGKVVEAEALLRWDHPSFGVVMPGKYISFLENDPCYYNLGFHILSMAIKDAKKVREVIPDFHINVNITAQQLEKAGFIDEVVEILKAEDFPAGALVLELTERCKEMDEDLLRNRVIDLREKGVLVAMDDVGTGYATLSKLISVPSDQIKIDKSLVAGIRENSMGTIFLDAVKRGCECSGATVCFEGVEDEETYEFLKQYNPSLCQGYYFSRPVYFDRFMEYVTEKNR